MNQVNQPFSAFPQVHSRTRAGLEAKQCPHTHPRMVLSQYTNQTPRRGSHQIPAKTMLAPPRPSKEEMGRVLATPLHTCLPNLTPNLEPPTLSFQSKWCRDKIIAIGVLCGRWGPAPLHGCLDHPPKLRPNVDFPSENLGTPYFEAPESKSFSTHHGSNTFKQKKSTQKYLIAHDMH